jgi:hypothetical protein
MVLKLSTMNRVALRRLVSEPSDRPKNEQNQKNVVHFSPLSALCRRVIAGFVVMKRPRAIARDDLVSLVAPPKGRRAAAMIGVGAAFGHS